jgi:hypothetical protein
MKHWPLRLFGIVCMAIGLWLMAGLISAIGEMLSYANTKREMSGVLAMPMIGLLLIAFGAIAVWRPHWLDKA